MKARFQEKKENGDLQTLKFIGSGSAFNTKLGNNSAYIQEGDSLLLIDCGSTTFDRMMKLDLLNGIKNIYVLITHTHSDHVGSLGDLIFYAYYVMNVKVKVYHPYNWRLNELLALMGVRKKIYDSLVIWEKEMFEISDNNIGFVSVYPFGVTHVPEINSCGYVLYLIHGKTIYYSGDSRNISPETISRLESNEFDEFYQDTCGLDYFGNPHLSLIKLMSLIPSRYRNRVYCMHLDQAFNKSEAVSYGFNVVCNEFE